jgi:hypothetical protein
VAAAFAGPGQALATGSGTLSGAQEFALNTADFGPYSGGSVWWKYTPGASPPANVTLNACGLSQFDNALAVYSGPASNPTIGSLSAVASNADDFLR